MDGVANDSAVDGVADDAFFIDDDGERKTFGANPCHHILRLNEMRPCEVVLVSNALGGLGIMVGGREEHHIRQLLLPLGKDGHFGSARTAAGVPEVEHHDATLHAVVHCEPVHGG